MPLGCVYTSLNKINCTAVVTVTECNTVTVLRKKGQVHIRNVAKGRRTNYKSVIVDLLGRRSGAGAAVLRSLDLG